MKTFLLLCTLFLTLVTSDSPDGYTREKFKSNLFVPDCVKHFSKLVDENNLNTTVIISKIGEDAASNTSFKGSIATTFPANKLALTSGKLNEELGQEFLRKSETDRLPRKFWRSKPNLEHIVSWYDLGYDFPVTTAHKVLTEIRNGTVGFTWDDKNFISHYTFLTPGANRTREITKIVYGHLDIEVVANKNFTEEEIKKMKKFFAQAWFTYTPTTFNRAVGALLRKNFPGESWQVVSNANQNNDLKAKKLVILKVLSENYLLYSI